MQMTIYQLHKGRYKLYNILVHVSYLIFSPSGKALSWGYVINQVLN